MNLEKRMKLYESKEAARKFIPLLPICVRLDGKNFSKYTKSLEKPFDIRFSKLMVKCTKELVEKTQAVIGYTQSDEISLIYYSSVYDSQLIHGGKISKLVSVLASMLTAVFNKAIANEQKPLALFDCRAWQVPDLEEAANVLLWRQNDAIRNSISKAASVYYPHKQLLNCSSNTKKEMLLSKRIHWEDYSYQIKRGAFVKKVVVSKPFTKEELIKLPPNHNAHKNPKLVVKRNVYKTLNIDLSKLPNKVDILFGSLKE